MKRQIRGKNQYLIAVIHEPAHARLQVNAI